MTSRKMKRSKKLLSFAVLPQTNIDGMYQMINWRSYIFDGSDYYNYSNMSQ